MAPATLLDVFEMVLALLSLLSIRSLPSLLMVPLGILVSVLVMHVLYRQLSPLILLRELDAAVTSLQSAWDQASEGGLIPRSSHRHAMKWEGMLVRKHAAACRRLYLNILDMPSSSFSIAYIKQIFHFRSRVQECVVMAGALERRIQIAVEDEHEAQCVEYLKQWQYLAVIPGPANTQATVTDH